MKNTPLPQRYTDKPLPPYSYVSGMHPHPLRDPAGHSYGAAEAVVRPPDESNWRECSPYLRGVDLFNAGYYWEAHESWEAVWRGAEPRSISADFFKGLIKLAAAGVKAREGRPAGVARHARRARELFHNVLKRTNALGDCCLGLPLTLLIDAAGDIEKDPQAYVDTRKVDVAVVFPLRLAPDSPE